MGMFSCIFGYHIDFFTDRLCRIYSVLLFLILAISLASEFQKPSSMECWAPAHFTSSMVRYSEQICKQTDQFHLPLKPGKKTNPGDSEPDKVMFSFNKLRYLPVVFCGQALLFLLPWLFWHLVSGGCCSLQGLVNDAAKMTSSNDPKIGKTIASEVLKLKSTGYSVLLGFSYLLTKAFYWAVCLLQMAILAWFMDINFFKFRHYQSSHLPLYNIAGDDKITEVTEVFPRVVMCEFNVQRLGNLQRYVVQCVIPISEVLERYLYIVWAWLILLVVLMTISGIFHFFKSIFWLVGIKSYKQGFVKRKLTNVAALESVPKSAIDKFGDLYLKPGVFLAFEILEENGSLHAVSMAVNHMWEEFVKASKIEAPPIDVQAYPSTYPPEVQGHPHESTPMVAVGGSVQKRPGPYDKVQGELNQV